MTPEEAALDAAEAELEDAREEFRNTVSKAIVSNLKYLETLEKILNPDSPSTLEKISGYEQVLHALQLNREVTMNPTAVRNLLDRIGGWSYSHRRGNGELSEQEQEGQIVAAFNRMIAATRPPFHERDRS